MVFLRVLTDPESYILWPAYTETLSREVAPFGVRVVLVQPGAHRTNIIEATAKSDMIQQKIADYDTMRSMIFAKYIAQIGKQPGDPAKAMDVVVDLVRGEGMVEGREPPLWLVLGSDAEQNLRDRMTERLQNLDEWADVTRSTTIHEEGIVLV